MGIKYTVYCNPLNRLWGGPTGIWYLLHDTENGWRVVRDYWDTYVSAPGVKGSHYTQKSTRRRFVAYQMPEEFGRLPDKVQKGIKKTVRPSMYRRISSEAG